VTKNTGEEPGDKEKGKRPWKIPSFEEFPRFSILFATRGVKGALAL
jgi:hypothetical protein